MDGGEVGEVGEVDGAVDVELALGLGSPVSALPGEQALNAQAAPAADRPVSTVRRARFGVRSGRCHWWFPVMGVSLTGQNNCTGFTMSATMRMPPITNMATATT